MALDHRIEVHELTPRSRSLEETFMSLTADEVEYHADVPEEVAAR